MTHTYYPRKPVVPFIKATQDRVVLEIQRGCIRGCRFCQGRYAYRPTRERDLEFLKDTARALIESTGHEEISLSSLSSSGLFKTAGADRLPDRGMFCPEGEYFPSFSADRRLFPGRDEQGPGYQKEQSGPLLRKPVPRDSGM